MMYLESEYPLIFATTLPHQGSSTMFLYNLCAPRFFGSRSESPVLGHFNVREDHVTVIDHRRRMFADVYFREGHVCCELCGEEDCEHIKYALKLSKVQKALERKDWIVREARKIIKKI